MDASLIPALQDVLVVAQTGAVGEAARRLHKTPSAVSQQIHRVEQRFGVTLSTGWADACAPARPARHCWVR